MGLDEDASGCGLGDEDDGKEEDGDEPEAAGGALMADEEGKDGTDY